MYKTHTLSNGLKVLVHRIPGIKSTSISYWVKSGTIFEKGFNGGIAHLLEHMMFKGTSNRSYQQIAREMDSVGGELNAYTSKEYTAYYAKVIDEDIDTALDLMCDMLVNSTFDQELLEKEKQIVLEEIKMYEDSPEELSYDMISEICYKGTLLSRPILGTQENVLSITREQLIEYYEKYYTANNSVLVVIGSFKHDELLEKLETVFSIVKPGQSHHILFENRDFNGGWNAKQKDFEQTYFNLSFKGPESDSKDFYAYHVMSNVLASTMSSRLFQLIREEMGLVYSVFSDISSYEYNGDFTISFTVSPKNLEKAAILVAKELKKLKVDGVGEEEFGRAKAQLRGGFILGLDSPSSILDLVGTEFLFEKKLLTPKEVLKDINSTSIKRVNEIASEIINENFALSIIGKNKANVSEKIYNKLRGILS